MGSYLGSCSGCSIDDGADMLKCTKCTKTCGAQIESSIAFSSCGSSAFGNNGGKLVCEDLPPGPYLRSCNNCNKGEDGNLSCVCTGGGGQRVDTRIGIASCPSGRFDNQEGKLVCEGSTPTGNSEL
eukprot:Tamp_23479.p2 GENE.Tamp_23479~~Tamp_23479.p2  ORF type:complete len:126 (-),score=8.70 Tamp_23479:525-902(-)